jgi:hypothetical protein
MLNRYTYLSPAHTSNGLEWMLQNPQVDDADLAAALVEVYHPALYAFALHLIGNTARAFALAVHASSTAVRKRHRLSIDSSLRAWLFGRIYQKCGRKKGWFEASQTWKEKQPPR